MSATNATTNYSLPVFLGSDKPAWLVDWNGAMAAIDAAIYAAKAEADTNSTAISGLQSTVSSQGSTISDQATAITGLRTDVDGNTGSINTINSLIGNGTPTTTDKTLIGAINELNAEIGISSIQTETLAAAGTSVEFDVPTSGNYLISFYIDGGADYTAIDTSVSGKVTLTYEAEASSRNVYCQASAVPSV